MRGRRLVSALASTALTAGLVVIGTTTTAVTPATAAVPPPSNTTAIVTVKVGGDRTSVSNVAGLPGVDLELWTNSNGSPGQKVNEPWAECTSDADGDCNFTVPDTERGGENRGERFWVLQAGTPAGWFSETSLVTGPSFQTSPYRFLTPELRATNTYSSTTLYDPQFMLGTGSSNRQASGGIWQTSRNNPSFPPKCGIRVALVLDVSGSVNEDLADLKTAAKTFVNSLVGTPSQVGLFTFATNAPANNTNNQNRPLTPVSTQAGADTVNGWIGSGNNGPGVTGLTSGGGTNWDRGLYQVAQSPDVYDVAVVITDGNPTYYSSDPVQGPGNFTRFREMENGIFSANAIKAEKTRVIAFGVGDGISGAPNNLIAISGSTEDSDYFQTTNYQEAGNALKALASANCEGTITVIKQVLPPNGQGLDGATPAGGWTFGAVPTDPLTVDPLSGETADGTGALSFDVDFNGETSGAVTLTETPQTGYTLEQVGGKNAVCKKLSDNSPVSVESVNNGFTVGALAGDGISCTVYNRSTTPPAEIVVNKEWVINDGAPVPNGQQPQGLSAALTLAPLPDPPQPQPWGVPLGGLLTGDQVTVNETVTNDLPLCVLDQRTIRSGDNQPAVLPVDGTTVDLAAGTNTYTVTNYLTCRSSLKLTKTVQGGPADPSDWTLTGKGPDGSLQGPSGSTGVQADVTPGALYALSESGGDPRYVQLADQNAVPIPDSTVSWTCKAVGDDGFSDGINGGVVVPFGFEVECGAVNQTSTLTLLKSVDNEKGGSGVPSDWDLTATPIGKVPSGLNPVTVEGADAASAENTFNVRPDQTYELTESGEDGYSLDNVVCIVNEGDPQWGDQITLDPLDTAVCTFTNRRDFAELKLVKKVEGADPNAWKLSADSTTADTKYNFSNDGGAGEFNTVFADTPYTLSEKGPGGYSPSAWSCVLEPREEVQPRVAEEIDLQGDVVTLKKNQRVTCTITNTRDLGSVTITKEFNPQQSGYTGTFDINYSCVDGATPVKNGTVSLGAGKSETITDLPTGTVCTVTEPTLPANPTGWEFNPPTFSPADGKATVTTKGQAATVTVVNSVAQVNPIVVKKICPIDVTLHKPTPKKVGNRILTDKIKTKKSSCVLLKPVVLCRPLQSTAAGEKAFCQTKVTKKGRVTVKTKGYDAVKVTVIVRAKPKPGFADRWKPNSWRKSWTLR